MGAGSVGVPDTRYARSGEVSIAYQVIGEHPRDLVWVRGNVSDLEIRQPAPPTGQPFSRRGARENRRMAQFRVMSWNVENLFDVGDDHGPDTQAELNAEIESLRMPVVLMDMNDEPEATTTLILNGPPGSEIDSVGFDQPDQGDGDRMWNTAALIEETKRFSRLYRGRVELIDHVFASHFLVTGTRTVEVTTVTAPQGMPSIEDDPNARIGKPGSDHAAVVATFDF